MSGQSATSVAGTGPELETGCPYAWEHIGFQRPAGTWREFQALCVNEVNPFLFYYSKPGILQQVGDG